MTHITNCPIEQLYEFRGKQFMSDEQTIKQLNYALALNRSNERYVLVKSPKKTDGSDQ